MSRWLLYSCSNKIYKQLDSEKFPGFIDKLHLHQGVCPLPSKFNSTRDLTSFHNN